MTDDLFSWQPPQPQVEKLATVTPFPMMRRVGKVRDVAAKMATKTTRRHVDAYREQVGEGLRYQMSRQGIEACTVESELASFWRAVEIELARLRSPARRGPESA